MKKSIIVCETKEKFDKKWPPQYEFVGNLCIGYVSLDWLRKGYKRTGRRYWRDEKADSISRT
jgi:hypothetical protein